MSARIWLAGGALVLVGLVLAAGFAFRYWQGKALYEPGSVSGRPDLAPPAQQGIQSDKWNVAPGINLHHFEVGSGEDVLVVHGGPGAPPLSPWKAAALTPGLRWVFYHQRGCGASTRPIDRLTDRNMYRDIQRVEGTLGLGAQVADIEGIRRILGREKLVLLGHSYGALIASLYAAEFPEHVRALILVSPANLVVMPGSGPDLFQRVGQRMPPSLAPEYADYLREYFDFRSLFKKDEQSLSVFYAQFRRYYGAAAGEGAPASQAAARGPELGGWMTMAVYLSGGRRHDWRPALRRVGAPVLVLHGAQDLQPERDSRAFASYFPAARVEVLPGAGHFAFDQQPRAFADAVAGFLAALD